MFFNSLLGLFKLETLVGKSGNHSYFIVNTTHSVIPNHFLGNIMKDFLFIVRIKLEEKTKKGEIHLFRVSLKYRKIGYSYFLVKYFQGL